MITNSFTAGYIVLAAIALALGVGGAVNGWLVLRRWRADQSSEAQYELEKRAYLVTALVTVALWMRVFLAPLWFWTLNSLIPEIPGAMCLTGVHMVRPAVAFTASAMKLLVPMLYALWLVLHAVDRRLPDQPLLRLKLGALIPVAAVLVVESACDLRYLLSVEPRRVTCCTSIFDRAELPVLQPLAQTTWTYTIVFFVCCGLLVVGALLNPTRRWALALVALLGGTGLVCFILALHVHLSPLLLRAPFHHCAFCVWQRLPAMRLASVLLVAGFWLALAYGVGGAVAGALPEAATAPLRRARLASAALLGLGSLIVATHLVLRLL